MSLATLLPRLALAAALTFTFGGAYPAAAQTLANPNPSAASIGYAKELLALKGAQQVFDGMIGSVIDRTKDTFIPTNPSLNKPLTEVAAQLKAEFEPKKAEVFNEAARSYARHFTEAELRELTAFYKTNLGRKVLSTEALAVEDSIKRVSEWQQNFTDQAMARLRAEMKKKGYDL
jgi:hypothetical protein